MLVAGDECTGVNACTDGRYVDGTFREKSVPVERISEGWAVNLGGRLQRVPACSRHHRFGALLNSVDESPASGFWRSTSAIRGFPEGRR